MARLGVRASASAQRVYELGKVSRAGFRWENTFGLLKPDGDGRGRVGGLDETRYLWKLGESAMAEKATWPRRWPFSSAQNPGDSFRGRASHEVESRTTSATVTEASVCFDIGAVPVRHALPGLELPHHVERRAGAAPVSPSRSTCCDRDSGHGQVGIDPGRLLLGSGESSVWGSLGNGRAEQALALGCRFQTSSTVLSMICAILISWRFCQDRDSPGSSFGQSTSRRGPLGLGPVPASSVTVCR